METVITRSATELRQEKEAARNLKHFAQHLLGITLRPYQLEAGNAIIKSVANRDGKTFVIIFSRQSGKDELLANLLLFLSMRFYYWGADMVCAQPTFKPQTINAMERLKKRGVIFGRNLTRTAGYIMRMGQARISYFSAEPAANQVGATADRLLIMNEAQDIAISVYDKRFSPMAASGNATKVFSGTSWTSDTLLSQMAKIAKEEERKFGGKQFFLVNCQKVGKVNAWYRTHVQNEIKRMGRQHPFIKTQYFCEEIDAQAGMFNAGRRALMIADQPSQEMPTPWHLYAFLIDVAGQDEAELDLEGLGNPGRDSETLDIVDVDLSALETMLKPTYRVIKRFEWTGEKHTTIYGKIKALADIWKPQHIVIDATGVGEGQWSMLDQSYPTQVIPVKFTSQSKSEIGWGYLAIIETGRFHDCDPNNTVNVQYDKCQSEILPGPTKLIRWGVKDGTRDTEGELVHDDYILADSLTAILDDLDWQITSPTLITKPIDFLKQEERNF